ncbi:RNA polymerase sigma-70 factor [Sphingobacterium sp. LRF_L2]|uniref:RNA polymerase sigma-70 factor n=1 Tax=Sphingobacterium sp. LRF_L2 TaxID=3369421 RepID=UPI003F5D5B1E
MSEVEVPLTLSINESTFTEVYNTSWEKVFTICYSHTDDVEVAKELVQDIFKSLWERRETLQINSCLERYVLRAAKLKVFEHIRNKQLRAEHLKVVAKGSIKESNITEDTIMHRALSETVEHIVGKLPTHCQRIFRMSHEKGMTNKEIANQLFVSERTVEYHLANALKQLKHKLGRYASTTS